MADLARAVACLRISGEHLVPAEVSALLGCEPSAAWAKGEQLPHRRTPTAATFGMWQFEANETEPAISTPRSTRF